MDDLKKKKEESGDVVMGFAAVAFIFMVLVFLVLSPILLVGAIIGNIIIKIRGRADAIREKNEAESGPGGKQAVKQGCICVVGPIGEKYFAGKVWVSKNCPLHGNR